MTKSEDEYKEKIKYINYCFTWSLIPFIIIIYVYRILVLGNYIYRLNEKNIYFKRYEYISFYDRYSFDYGSKNLVVFFIILFSVELILILITEYKLIEFKKSALNWLIVILLFDIVLNVFMYYYISEPFLFLAFKFLLAMGCYYYNKYKDEYKDPFVN